MRRVLTLAVFFLAAVGPSPARDLFVDYLAGYLVEAPVLNAPNCAGAAFEDPRLRPFEQALCFFHKPAPSPEDLQQAIDLMEQAQVAGLPPVHQQLASLVNGLAHCAGAQRHLDRFRDSGNQNELERTYFCRDRRAAQAELQAIRWNHALFDYAPGLPPQQTLNARITEMSACHAGVLAPAFDAECGLITTMTDSEIRAFVDEAVGQTVIKYFSGVESSITAMFARKLERAQGLLESSGAAIGGLEATAGNVNAEYEGLNRAYEAARDSKMAPIYERYREAILRATSILDEFERWQGGLFITAENVNLLPTISQRSAELEEELARIEDLQFRDKALALVEDIRRIVNGEEEDRAAVATLCKIYFCELTSRRAIAGVIRACRRPALADNPLCIEPDGRIVDGKLTATFAGTESSIDIVDMCRGAGVDVAFTAVNLAPEASATCLANLP
jgi:hypothetical protein